MTRSRLVFGLLFVALGTLLFLEQAGLATTWVVLAEWWPTIVIAAGVAQWVTRPRNALGGTIVGLIGVALLLWTLGIVDTVALLWPTVLIGLGLWLLTRRPGPNGWPLEAGDETLALFDNRTERAPTGPLTGRSVTAVFGDVDLDLRAATIDEVAALQVSSIFGDVDLEVPATWRVTVSGPEIFGDVRVDLAGDPPADAPLLRLQVLTVFGDIEVRSRATTVSITDGFAHL